ncbi:helix-turn-helix transcriptional regulator [Auraticoccus monumenti]|uniref:Helix-turn-helix domain-containing protein n=1 Tax=Auraticoccus monumenti TaxID=675864 RepID=A0A1G6WGU3_9ACTN|nr:helix-turn-helix transcriptional regulator [Auraticoccus monumenti]SDD65031.1 Helix-turn-helix domain-containing protein [Auraticoccus monumenti]
MPTGIRTDLGRYLRARRGTMPAPACPAGGRTSRRQVPGLRRQELAVSAGISVEYYTRLEQGRAPRPSREVLTALAGTLGLTPAERDHLFRLAGELPPEPLAPDSELRPGLRRLLDGLDHSLPVTVHDGRLDVVARNGAATELLGPLPGAGRYRRNIVHQGFTDAARQALGNEGADRYAAWAAAELRSAMGRYPEDAQLRSMQAELSTTSVSFRVHWARGQVATERSGVKHLRHPTRGWLSYQSEMLHDPERDHWVVIYAPVG